MAGDAQAVRLSFACEIEAESVAKPMRHKRKPDRDA